MVNNSLSLKINIKIVTEKIENKRKAKRKEESLGNNSHNKRAIRRKSISINTSTSTKIIRSQINNK